MSSSSSAADARRRAEIEAKKAKLQEIRRQREQRALRLKSTASSLPESSSSSTAGASSRKDLDDLVNSLISGSGTRSSRPSLVGDTGSPRKSLLATTRDPPSSEFGGSESEVPPSTPGGAATNHHTTAADASVRSAQVELIDVETELFELPQKQRVYYTKEVQTAAVGDSDDDHQDQHYSRGVHAGGGPSGGVGAEASVRESEETLRARILAEHQADLAQRAEEERLEREIASQLRELSEEERVAIYSAQDFGDFVEQSSKIVERALTDLYDYMRDYRIGGDDQIDVASGSQLRLVRRFGAGDKTFANRSITAIDWSTKYPELCVVAYNRNDQDEDAPDGLVAVWNTHLADRPEFVFHAQTDVLSVCFSPFHPNLVVGGTYSGQILIWDTRARSLPVLKTPLSAAGHTHPVYGLKIIGSANAHNLVSASTDGTICWWMLDMLARPQETLELVNTLHPKTDEVAVTTLGVPDQETTVFLVGSEDGCVYAGNRYDRAGLKAGLSMAEIYRGHVAAVTGLDFHPLNGAVDLSDLFLTSSMDWTSKLWRLKPGSSSSSSTTATAMTATASSTAMASLAGGSATSTPSTTGISPVLAFEESNDYVYDIRWSPSHPAVFGQVDGTGRLDIFNLIQDHERPIASVSPSSSSSSSSLEASASASAEVGVAAKALNKLGWCANGRQLAVGGAQGVLYVYQLSDALSVATDDEASAFQAVVAKLLSEAAASNTGRAAAAAAAASL